MLLGSPEAKGEKGRVLACLVVGTGVVWVKRQRLFGPAFVGNGVVSVKRRAVQVCCVMAGLPGDVQGSSPWLLLTL